MRGAARTSLLAGILFAGVWAPPSFAADIFLFQDIGSTIQVTIDGGAFATCSSDTLCDILVDRTDGASITSTLPLNFNIWDDASKTLLSDTVAFSLTSTGGFPTVESIFKSNEPSTALLNATDIIETGGIQVLTTVTFSDGAALTYEFQSDEFKVPEPASLALFGAGLGALGLMRRRKRKASYSRTLLAEALPPI